MCHSQRLLQLTTSNVVKAILPLLIASLSIMALAGCKTNSVAQYVSPRITGRVLDAKSNEPIKGVKVERAEPSSYVQPDSPQKAGEVMQSERGVSTGDDGAFTLDSKRTVSVFSAVGWYSVTVNFKKDGYKHASANYSRTNAVRSAQGEPVVNAGDILLEPIAK